MYLWPRKPTPIFRKRGQSLETTLTASSYPTARPSSSYSHGHPVPTIDGSTGGFIGLIVGLGVLAIVSSIAVWFFWRRYQRNKNAPYGQSGGGFPKPGFGIFGKKKNKGWMQTHSYTDGDEDGIRLDAQGRQQPYGAHPNESTASVGVPSRGRMYDDPFNADSLDNLQRETSAKIDQGPQYQRVAAGERAMSPPLAGGTRFHEGL